MSKAARIRELYADGKTTAVIATIVGCRPEYVRVAGRQRKDGMSKSDVKWLMSAYPEARTLREAVNLKRQAFHAANPHYARDYFKKRYHGDPAFRLRWLRKTGAYNNRRYATDPAFRQATIDRTKRNKRRRRLEAAQANRIG